MLHWTHSIHHDGSMVYVSPGPYTLGQTITIRLRAGIDAPLDQVFLSTCPDGEQLVTPMLPTEQDSVCRWWEVDLKLQMAKTNYRFYLVTSAGVWWYNAAGMQPYTPPDTNDFKLLAGYQAPAWVQDSVFYQIFPDRFADGDPGNNVQTGEYDCYGRSVVAREWNEPPSPRPAKLMDFYGGDLQGIIQRLDYLTDLGVSALYLTPIFTSPSNHKYDVADYRQVDLHFGGDAALVALRQALDERGMRLMLDITPNHCSSIHPWFLAAQSDPEAPTAEFFTFEKRPDKYATWLGVRSLPKLNYRSQRLRDEMFAGNDAIMRYWLRPPFRIDGWRLDVANMLGRQGENQFDHKIGRHLRRAIKSEKPEAYLLGENFYDASPYLQGDELDASMNYRGFLFPLLHWLAGFDMIGATFGSWNTRPLLSTESLAAQWQFFLAVVPWQIAVQQFNLLDSHDTPRFQTVLNEDAALIRLAVTLLFTYPGVPSIYYGDEIGLTGRNDPDSRRTMPWNPDRWNGELRDFYRTLIALRRESPALRRGGYQLLYAAGDTLAFMREAPEERLLIVARRGDDELETLPVSHGGLADGVRLCELFSGLETTVSGGELSLNGCPDVGASVWRVAVKA
jgi:alpha-glucosidase